MPCLPRTLIDNTHISIPALLCWQTSNNGAVASRISRFTGERQPETSPNNHVDIRADGLSQSSLSPNQAVSVLEERVKLIGKINTDIADWLSVGDQDPCLSGSCSSTQQERRRVEETYVQGLKKLANRRPHDAAAELG